MKNNKNPLYFRILGLAMGIDYSRSFIVESFVKKLKTTADFLAKGIGDAREFYDLTQAAYVCTSPGLTAEYLEIGHEVWMSRHPVTDQEVERVAGGDWLTYALFEIGALAADIRVDRTALDAMTTESYTDILAMLPAHIRGDRVELGVGAIVEELLSYVDPNEKTENDRYGLEKIDPDRIRWVWKTTHPKKNGRAILGSCKALGKKDRNLQKRGTPYLWEITFSLDYWLVAGEQERRRLVHHEMAHCKPEVEEDGSITPKVNGHDIEEMLPTMIHFGPLDESQSAVIRAGNLHKQIDPLGMGPLFRGVESVTLTANGRTVNIGKSL